MLFYEGITENGEKISGTFFGKKEELVENLRKQNIVLISVKEKKQKTIRKRYTLIQFSKDIEQLHYFISSGMQIDKAIQTIIRNANSSIGEEFWRNVLKFLKEGKQLSDSIKHASKDIRLNMPELYINVISVGEQTGNVAISLKKVAEQLQFRNSLVRELKSALIYPSFVVFVSLVAVFLIVYLILPRFSSIFSQKDFNNMPFLSKIIIEAGNFIHTHTVYVLVSLFVFIGMLFWLFLSQAGKQFLKGLAFEIPLIKRVALEWEIANMCSAIGTMINGGVEISKAIRLSVNVVQNKTLSNILKNTYSEVKKGNRISDIWSQYEIIPADIVSMVVVGENSAKMGEIFIKLGNRYIENFKTDVSRMLTILEPAIIILLGIFIGIIVVAIMLAVISVNNVAV